MLWLILNSPDQMSARRGVDGSTKIIRKKKQQLNFDKKKKTIKKNSVFRWIKVTKIVS